MNWFEKRINDRNELEARLIKRKFGLAGYGIYESLQQIVAENMEGDDISEWGFISKAWTMESLAENIGCSVDEFRQFVEFCDDQLILEQRSGRLFMPMMLERMNEYAKRQYRKSQRKQETTKTPDTTDSPNVSAIQHNTVQHNTVQHKDKLNNSSAVEEKNKSEEIDYEALLEEKGGVRYEWQDTAIEIIESLGVPPEKKSSVFRVCKEEPEGRVHSAFQFAVDYSNKKLRWKMFFWKLNQIKKEKSGKAKEGG